MGNDWPQIHHPAQPSNMSAKLGVPKNMKPSEVLNLLKTGFQRWTIKKSTGIVVLPAMFNFFQTWKSKEYISERIASISHITWKTQKEWPLFDNFLTLIRKTSEGNTPDDEEFENQIIDVIWKIKSTGNIVFWYLFLINLVVTNIGNASSHRVFTILFLKSCTPDERKKIQAAISEQINTDEIHKHNTRIRDAEEAKKNPGESLLLLELTMMSDLIRTAEFLEFFEFLDKNTQTTWASTKVTLEEFAECFSSGGLISGLYEGSAKRIGIGNWYHLYVSVSPFSISEENAAPYGLINIMIVPEENCINEKSNSGTMLPIDVDTFKKHHKKIKTWEKYRALTDGITLSIKINWSRVTIEANQELHGWYIKCVKRYFMIENTILHAILWELSGKKIRRTEDKTESVWAERIYKSEHADPEKAIMPYTFWCQWTDGWKQGRTWWIVAWTKQQVRHATLGWSVVLPSGHLPEMETLKTNQWFFPQFPGTPQIGLSLFRLTENDNNRTLEEIWISWEMTDVSSELWYCLSFAQWILWSIEYLNMHAVNINKRNLQELADEIHAEVSTFLMLQRRSAQEENDFLKKVREWLRDINKLSPNIQLRCKTHALPDDWEKQQMQTNFSAHRLGGSNGIRVYEEITAEMSDSVKSLLSGMPARLDRSDPTLN